MQAAAVPTTRADAKLAASPFLKWAGGKGQLPQILAGKPSDKLKANDVIWEFFRNHPKK